MPLVLKKTWTSFICWFIFNTSGSLEILILIEASALLPYVDHLLGCSSTNQQRRPGTIKMLKHEPAEGNLAAPASLLLLGKKQQSHDKVTWTPEAERSFVAVEEALQTLTPSKEKCCIFKWAGFPPVVESCWRGSDDLENDSGVFS